MHENEALPVGRLPVPLSDAARLRAKNWPFEVALMSKVLDRAEKGTRKKGSKRVARRQWQATPKIRLVTGDRAVIVRSFEKKDARKFDFSRATGRKC